MSSIMTEERLFFFDDSEHFDPRGGIDLDTYPSVDDPGFLEPAIPCGDELQLLPPDPDDDEQSSGGPAIAEDDGISTSDIPNEHKSGIQLSVKDDAPEPDSQPSELLLVEVDHRLNGDTIPDQRVALSALERRMPSADATGQAVEVEAPSPVLPKPTKVADRGVLDVVTADPHKPEIEARDQEPTGVFKDSKDTAGGIPPAPGVIAKDGGDVSVPDEAADAGPGPADGGAGKGGDRPLKVENGDGGDLPPRRRVDERELPESEQAKLNDIRAASIDGDTESSLAEDGTIVLSLPHGNSTTVRLNQEKGELVASEWNIHTAPADVGTGTRLAMQMIDECVDLDVNRIEKTVEGEAELRLMESVCGGAVQYYTHELIAITPEEVLRIFEHNRAQAQTDTPDGSVIRINARIYMTDLLKAHKEFALPEGEILDRCRFEDLKRTDGGSIYGPMGGFQRRLRNIPGPEGDNVYGAWKELLANRDAHNGKGNHVVLSRVSEGDKKVLRLAYYNFGNVEQVWIDNLNGAMNSPHRPGQLMFGRTRVEEDRERDDMLAAIADAFAMEAIGTGPSGDPMEEAERDLLLGLTRNKSGNIVPTEGGAVLQDTGRGSGISGVYSTAQGCERIVPNDGGEPYGAVVWYHIKPDDMEEN